MPITLSKKAVAAVEEAVDGLFDKVTARYLGPDAAQRGDKTITIGYRPDLTLQSLYHAAAREEATRPHAESVESLADIARGYLNLARQTTKMKVVRAVESFLRDAQAKGESPDVATVLGGQLADVWKTSTYDVTKILDSEAIRARNLGTLEGITKVNAAAGIEDPAVFFVVVRDSNRCEECTRVHLLPDGVTPRLWRMSEITSAYHVRGDDKPSWCGMHPHCRCTPATMMPGYGFDKAGMVTFISRDHDEFEKQRG